MKTCYYCASELNDEVAVCAVCGKSIDEQQIEPSKQKLSILAVIAFCASSLVLAFTAFLFVEFVTVNNPGVLIIATLLIFMALPATVVSLALSCVALPVTLSKKQRGKGFAIAALAMDGACVLLFIAFIVIIAVVKATA